MLCARTGAVAIAASLALSPTLAAAAPKPVVDLSASPALSDKPAAQPAAAPDNVNERIMEIGGGVFVLLALGGAVIIARRRRRQEKELAEMAYVPETAVEQPAATPRHDPLIHQEQPAIVAPSAFAWGDAQSAAPTSNGQASDDESDRRPGESWVERAYRGPSPANPSVALRARLKRAVFFDKREREVAAGEAAPVDTDAGLPEAMVEEQERELNAA
jgi:hypothetical protein